MDVLKSNARHQKQRISTAGGDGVHEEDVLVGHETSKLNYASYNYSLRVPKEQTLVLRKGHPLVARRRGPVTCVTYSLECSQR